MIIDLAAVQAANSGCQGRHVEAGLQAGADATVTVEDSKMPSNALYYMHGQRSAGFKPPTQMHKPSWLQV